MKAQDIIAKLGKLDVVKAKDIYTELGHIDGGKMMRRHLRAKFAVNHNASTAWEWKQSDDQWKDVVEYMLKLSEPVEKPVEKAVKIVKVDKKAKTKKMTKKEFTEKMIEDVKELDLSEIADV